MMCSQAELLAPMYLSGELQGEAATLFAEHLQSCRECAASVESARQLDDVLRAAVLRQPVNEQPVLERVRSEMGAVPATVVPKFEAWPAILAVIGGLIVVTLISLNIAGRRHSPAPVAENSPGRTSIAAAAQPSTIYTEAAEDHRDEVVQHYRRKWLRGNSEISQLVSQKVGDPAVLAALAPEGYRVDRARICELGEKDYLHLVYTDGRHEISFFLSQQDGAQLEGNPVAQSGGAALHAASAESLQVAGFQAQRYTVIVVSDQPADETLHFASKAAKSVMHLVAAFAPASLGLARALAA